MTNPPITGRPPAYVPLELTPAEALAVLRAAQPEADGEVDAHDRVAVLRSLAAAVPEGAPPGTPVILELHYGRLPYLARVLGDVPLARRVRATFEQERDARLAWAEARGMGVNEHPVTAGEVRARVRAELERRGVDEGPARPVDDLGAELDGVTLDEHAVRFVAWVASSGPDATRALGDLVRSARAAGPRPRPPHYGHRRARR